MVIFNNGISLQWGIRGNPGTNIGNITFPISFNTRAYSISPTDWNNGSTGQVFAIGIDVNGRTPSSCNYVSVTNSKRGVCWLAIGY